MRLIRDGFSFDLVVEVARSVNEFYVLKVPWRDDTRFGSDLEDVPL